MRQRGTQRVCFFFRSDARIVLDGHGRDNDSKISRQGRSVLAWKGTFSYSERRKCKGYPID